MKKLLATLLAASLALIGTQAFAQMSVNAGYLNTSSRNSNASNPSNYNGFYAGVTYNIPIVAGLCVAPGVYYSMIGGKETSSGSLGGLISGSNTTTFTEHAINGSINLNYGFQVARDMRAFVFAGPTLQYGFSSKIKSKTDVGGIISGSSNSTYDLYENTLKPLNIFIGGGIGMEVANFQVTVGYDYGLMNISKNTNTTINRSGLKLGVGFLF